VADAAGWLASSNVRGSKIWEVVPMPILLSTVRLPPAWVTIP